MIDSLPEPTTMRRWIVCESGDRWLQALGRFAPGLMPHPLVATVTPAEADSQGPDGLAALLAGQERAVVLWEVQRSHLLRCCDGLAATASRQPKILQLVAAGGLSECELIALTEFNAAVTLRHPEQLPSLAAMIHGYFANPA